MIKHRFEDGIYYSGTTEEIQQLLKSVRRAGAKGKTHLKIPYDKPAIFSKKRHQYALHFDEHGFVHVLSSDKMMDIIDKSYCQ